VVVSDAPVRLDGRALRSRWGSGLLGGAAHLAHQSMDLDRPGSKTAADSLSVGP